MKTTKLSLLIAILFVINSCTTNETLIQEHEQDSTVKRARRGSKCGPLNYFNDVDLYYKYTKNRLNELNEKQNTKQFVFVGNRSFDNSKKSSFINRPNVFNSTFRNSTKQTVDQEIEYLKHFEEHLLYRVGPRVPPCYPPKVCLKDNNCNLIEDLRGIEGIVIYDLSTRILEISITDDSGEVVGRDNGIVEGENGERIMRIEYRFKGKAIMTTTIETRDCGTIQVLTPVYFE